MAVAASPMEKAALPMVCRARAAITVSPSDSAIWKLSLPWYMEAG
jgi:hypothetical protein